MRSEYELVKRKTGAINGCRGCAYHSPMAPITGTPTSSCLGLSRYQPTGNKYIPIAASSPCEGKLYTQFKLVNTVTGDIVTPEEVVKRYNSL